MLFARAGSAFSFYLNGVLLDRIGMSNAIWIAVGLTSLGTLAALIQGKVDTDQEDKEKKGRSLGKSAKEGWHIFKTNVEPVYWCFTMALFLIFSLVTTFTVNAPILLEVNILATKINSRIWAIKLLRLTSTQLIKETRKHLQISYQRVHSYVSEEFEVKTSNVSITDNITLSKKISRTIILQK